MRLVARLCLSLLQTVRYYDEGASSPRPALPSAGSSGETGDSEWGEQRSQSQLPGSARAVTLRRLPSHHWHTLLTASEVTHLSSSANTDHHLPLLHPWPWSWRPWWSWRWPPWCRAPRPGWAWSSPAPATTRGTTGSWSASAGRTTPTYTSSSGSSSMQDRR